MGASLNLYDTKLPVLKIVSADVGTKYEYIGSGEEGIVYKFDERTAIKIFRPFDNRFYRGLKFQKVETYVRFDDDAFTYPIGLVGYEDEQKEGYYMGLVHVHEKYPTFNTLVHYPNPEQKMGIILDGDRAIRRAHHKGLFLGDIKNKNILIDRDLNIIFADTDNFGGLGFGHDVEPLRANWLAQTYGQTFSKKDIDKFLYALKAIHIIIGYPIYELPKEFYYELIMKLDVSISIKNGLLEIFSDLREKPYIGEVLKDVDPSVKILSLENATKLNLND